MNAFSVDNPKYLLAMFCRTSYLGSQEKNDLINRIKNLSIKSRGELYKVINMYYPLENIKPDVRKFIDEYLITIEANNE